MELGDNIKLKDDVDFHERKQVHEDLLNVDFLVEDE